MSYNKSSTANKLDPGQVEALYREVMRNSPSGPLWRGCRSQSSDTVALLLVAIQPDKAQTISHLDTLQTQIGRCFALTPLTPNASSPQIMSWDAATYKTCELLHTYLAEVGGSLGTHNQLDPVVPIRLPYPQDTKGWSRLCFEAAKLASMPGNPLTAGQKSAWVRATAKHFDGQNSKSYADFTPEKLLDSPAPQTVPTPPPKNMLGVALGI